MKVEREIKMELTFDNLVNYIINEEFEASKKMKDYGEILGENAPETSRKRAYWMAYFKIAKEFGFVDKLKR